MQQTDKTQFIDNLKFIESKTSTKIKWKKILLPVAAILVLLLSVLIYCFQHKTSTDQLYAEYFSPYRNVIKPVVRGEQNKDSLQIAFAFYEAHQYQKAQDYFEHLSTRNEYRDLLFYQAMTLLTAEKYSKALTLLQTYRSKQERFSSYCYWYEALIHLKQDNLVKAKKSLSFIIKNNYYNEKKAKELLERLE